MASPKKANTTTIANAAMSDGDLQRLLAAVARA